MSNIKDNLLQLIGKTPLVRLSNIPKIRNYHPIHD